MSRFEDVVLRVGSGIFRGLAPHLLTYPVTIVWAIASIVPTMFTFRPADLGAKTEAAAANAILFRTLVPVAIVFVLAHLPIIPMVLTEDPVRGAVHRRRFFWFQGIVFGLGALVMVAGWGWLFLFYGK